MRGDSVRYRSASMPETVELHFSNGLFDQDNAALGDFGSCQTRHVRNSLMGRAMQDAFRCDTNSDFLRRFCLNIQANGHMNRIQ